MGTFTALDSDPFTGEGSICFAGEFSIPEGEGTPNSVQVGNIDFPLSSTLNLPNGKTVFVSGNVAFDQVPPLQMNGSVTLNGTGSQTVTGKGARFDQLEIDNQAGS